MKAEHPPFRMIVRAGKLVPASGYDEERLATFALESEITCTIVRDANPKLARYWMLLNLAVKQCPTPWKTTAEAHGYLKLTLGVVSPIQTPHGDIWKEPRSLSDLEPGEFDEFFEGAMALLWHITGVDPETLQKEAAGDGGKKSLADPQAPRLAGDKGGGTRPPDSRAAADPNSETVQQGVPNRIAADFEDEDSLAGYAAGDDEGGGGAAGISATGMPPADQYAPPDERAMLDNDGQRMSTTALKAEAIAKLVALATDATLTIDERRLSLAQNRQGWIDTLPGHPEFVRTAFQTADKIIKGELAADSAKRYLFSLKDG